MMKNKNLSNYSAGHIPGTGFSSQQPGSQENFEQFCKVYDEMIPDSSAESFARSIASCRKIMLILAGYSIMIQQMR